MEDGFWAVRVQIGWAFGKIGGERAIDGLIDLFNDSMMEVQAEAVLAMASMGVGTVPKLIACLKDERRRGREQAAKSLGLLKDSQAVQGLILAGRDRDGAVKSAAAEALGRIGDSKAVPALIKLFGSSPKRVGKLGRIIF